MIDFTIEIYKSDKRKKEGKVLVDRVEMKAADRDEVVEHAEAKVSANKKLSYEVHETYREVRNIMSGKIVKEHYLTPWSCSVASESYFCS